MTFKIDVIFIYKLRIPKLELEPILKLIKTFCRNFSKVIDIRQPINIFTESWNEIQFDIYIHKRKLLQNLINLL